MGQWLTSCTSNFFESNQEEQREEKMNFLFGLKKEPEKISEGFQPLRKYDVLLTQTHIDCFYTIKKLVMRTIYENHLKEFFTDAQLKEIIGELNKLAKSDKDALKLAEFLQEKIQEYSTYFPFKHYLIDDFAFLRHLKEYGWNIQPAAKVLQKPTIFQNFHSYTQNLQKKNF